MKKLLLACTSVVLSAVPTLAVENPWVGTWKMDPSKGHSSGYKIAYSKLESGLYRWSIGDVGFDFGMDGKEYKALGDSTLSQTQVGDNAWRSVWKENAKVVSDDHAEISADGQTLTVLRKSTRPDGSTDAYQVIFIRVSGTNDLIGEWEEARPNPYSCTLIVSSPSPGVLRWDSPEYKQTVEGKLDGSDLPVTGPDLSPGMTYAFTTLSPRKQAYTVKHDGNPTSFGTRTLSEDGKTITDLWWNVGNESEKITSVYYKQYLAGPSTK